MAKNKAIIKEFIKNKDKNEIKKEEKFKKNKEKLKKLKESQKQKKLKKKEKLNKLIAYKKKKKEEKEINTEEKEEKSEEIIAPIGNKQGILVFGGKNGRRIREEREEREEREKIDLEKIAKRLENKRDGEIRLEENSANNEEKIKKIKDKYEKIYKNYILKNEFLIKVKFGQNYKKELSPYIPALIQRKNFFLNNTLIGKIMREKKEKSKENEEKNEEESEKKK